MFEGEDTVLVIGAHPDDEVLGVGGAMAKHADSGDEVHVLIVTEGTTQQYEDESLIEQKRADTRACANKIGATAVHFGDLPDMRLDEVAHVDVNAVIEDMVDEIEPDVVYTHSKREVNRDHVAVHESTLVATRPGLGVSTVLAYETPSSTDYAPTTDGFEPDLFVDISAHLDTKVAAFNAYETEVREYPHPRSAEALNAIAKARGTSANVAAAEAFDILRAYA
jgi:LmbE family N-acetylglucosaminyl deacetylase